MPYQDQAKWILFPVSFLWMELKFNTWISDHDILGRIPIKGGLGKHMTEKGGYL